MVGNHVGHCVQGPAHISNMESVASNISCQSDRLQIYPTTLTWLRYTSTQYIHPNISGHNVQGQTFSIQCNNIYPSKGKKINGQRTY